MQDLVEVEQIIILLAAHLKKYQELFFLKEKYIQKRNRIVDNFLKMRIPYYKKELRRIDERLDDIEGDLHDYCCSIVEKQVEICRSMFGRTNDLQNS